MIDLKQVSYLQSLSCLFFYENAAGMVSYFASKLKEFYKHCIYNIIDKWNEVLESNGGYFSI